MRKLLLVLSLLVLPGSVESQDHSTTREFRLGAALGWGEGPSVTAVAGIRVGVDVGSRMGLEVEYSRWGHGIPGGCTDGDVQGCHGDATAFLGGLTATAPLASWLEGYLQLNGGAYNFSGVPRGETAAGLKPSLGFDLGGRLRASKRVGVHLKGRLLEVYGDQEYKAEVGDDLRYAMLMVGVDYALAF